MLTKGADKGQVFVEANSEHAGIYLTAQFGADQLQVPVAKALDSTRGKWDDPEYIAGVAFLEIIHNPTTGQGLCRIGTNRRYDAKRVIRLVCAETKVSDECCQPAVEKAKRVRSYSFEEFIEGALGRQPGVIEGGGTIQMDFDEVYWEGFKIGSEVYDWSFPRYRRGPFAALVLGYLQASIMVLNVNVLISTKHDKKMIFDMIEVLTEKVKKL